MHSSEHAAMQSPQHLEHEGTQWVQPRLDLQLPHNAQPISSQPQCSQGREALRLILSSLCLQTLMNIKHNIEELNIHNV